MGARKRRPDKEKEMDRPRQGPKGGSKVLSVARTWSAGPKYASCPRLARNEGT